MYLQYRREYRYWAALKWVIGVELGKAAYPDRAYRPPVGLLFTSMGEILET